MTDANPKGKPKTQPSFSGGPPRPPKKTARGLADEWPHPDPKGFREALNALAAHDKRKAELVKLRYFGGMTLSEAAKALGVSESTAKRDWAYARVWLFREMEHASSKGRPKTQPDLLPGPESSEVLKKARELNISGAPVPSSTLDKITAAYLRECCQQHSDQTPQSPSPLPPITGEITVPPQMTVRQLADALGKNPFQIIADLMEIEVFATVNQLVTFETISKVVRKYGFTAKRAV